MTILPRLRLAVIGSGIGGLALTVALSKLGLDEALEIDVYESTAKLAPVGAGISIWPRAWDILKKMGLEKALSERSPPSASASQGKTVSGFSYRKSDQKQGVPIVEVKLPCGPRAFHRADMQEVLLNHTSSLIRFHFCHRLKKYNRTSSGIELTFWNGKNVTCDLLIGADGINSTVRNLFLAEGNGSVECSRPKWTGTVAYRSLIEAEDVRRVNPQHPALERYMVYCGKNKHIVMYPIMQGRYVNTIQFVTDPTKEGTYISTPSVVDLSEDGVPTTFSGWEDDAQCIVKLVSKPSKWAIQTVGPLDKYASECVVLLGDAAHGMAPHLGNGAAQAIEDAYMLANLIAAGLGQGHTYWDTKRITDAYNLVRQPFGNFVVNATRQQGRRYDLNTPALKAVNEGDFIPACELADLGRSIEEGWEWTWNTSVTGDLERALAVL